MTAITPIFAQAVKASVSTDTTGLPGDFIITIDSRGKFPFVVAKDMVLWRDQVLAREAEEEVDRLRQVQLSDALPLQDGSTGPVGGGGWQQSPLRASPCSTRLWSRGPTAADLIG